MADHHPKPSTTELVAKVEENIDWTLDTHAPIQLVDHSEERHGAVAVKCMEQSLLLHDVVLMLRVPGISCRLSQ